MELRIMTSDPTQAWIDFLLHYGGYWTLLGAPALIATGFILKRIWFLRTHRHPHSYGRTEAIYWPSQIFITLAFLNRDEHLYETRSSDTLFLHYSATITVSSIAIYILLDQEDTTQPSLQQIVQGLAYFTLFLVLGLAVESWPRKRTRVQTNARLKDSLNEYDQANLFSRLTFHYVDGIVSLGSKRPLVGQDIDHTTPDYLRTHHSFDIVSKAWEKEVARAKASNGKRTPSFFWTVLGAYRGRVFEALFLRCVAFRLPFLTPILFGQLLVFITEYYTAVNAEQQDWTTVPPLKIGLVIAFAMFAINSVGTILGTMAFQSSFDLGMEARGATIAMVYRKALKLSPAARQKSTLGEITNHMAVDAEKWINASTFMPAMFFIPVDIAISMYLLVAIVVPLNAKMARFLNTFQDEKLKWMDTRIRVLTEILSSIKIVKLHGWEDAFRDKINALRIKELLAHKRFVTVKAVLAIVFSSVTLIMALATFTLYATIGGPGGTPGKMTAEVIFVGITLFGVLNRPLGRVTMMISQTIAIRVACHRIENFLLLEEIDTSIIQRYSRQTPSPDATVKPVAIEIENGTFSWDKQPEPTTATDSNAGDETQPLLSRAA
ncbi:Multidrug resistance-associated protein 1, partial [Podila epigama]